MHRIKMQLAMISLGITTLANAGEGFQITSSATAWNGTVPTIYTCDGKNISPKITWSGAPAKTEAFALIVSDPDAPDGTFYHWGLYNIPKNTAELAEGIQALPTGTMVAVNSFGKQQYSGPCPPKMARHRYVFTIYALDGVLTLPANANVSMVETEAKKHALAQTNVTSNYR